MRKILPVVLGLLLMTSLMLAGCEAQYNKGDSVTRWGIEVILNTDLSEFPD